MLKIDLRKAYDTLEWTFIKDMLIFLNFPSHFINIFMTCISTTQFSLILNGSPMPLFKSKRGIRQGDPMSPLIFVICMEYLSRLLKTDEDHVNFMFHPRCNRLKLKHLCFAKDLMIFCWGDLASNRILLNHLEIFAKSSGLVANSSKSDVYIAGIATSLTQYIVDSCNIPLGSMRFRYLGVLLSSKRLSTAECEHLAVKMTSKVRSWQARNLSYVARLQFVSSVLMNITNFWCQIFVLPKKVLK